MRRLSFFKFFAGDELQIIRAFPIGAGLPVIGSRNLRANLKNRQFARNRELEFTGKFQKSPFCP